jgi:preprotein translocase subunit SecB
MLFMVSINIALQPLFQAQKNNLKNIATLLSILCVNIVAQYTQKLLQTRTDKAARDRI